VSTSGLSGGDASAPNEDGATDASTGGTGFGVLYDARVYDRALTAGEVAALPDGTACP
jgi:hypothetical protein